MANRGSSRAVTAGAILAAACLAAPPAAGARVPIPSPSHENVVSVDVAHGYVLTLLKSVGGVYRARLARGARARTLPLDLGYQPTSLRFGTDGRGRLVVSYVLCGRSRSPERCEPHAYDVASGAISRVPTGAPVACATERAAPLLRRGTLVFSEVFEGPPPAGCRPGVYLRRGHLPRRAAGSLAFFDAGGGYLEGVRQGGGPSPDNQDPGSDDVLRLTRSGHAGARTLQTAEFGTISNPRLAGGYAYWLGGVDGFSVRRRSLRGGPLQALKGDPDATTFGVDSTTLIAAEGDHLKRIAVKHAFVDR